MSAQIPPTSNLSFLEGALVIVTAKQLEDPNFINQMLHSPLRAKIMAAIAVILFIGSMVATALANGYCGNDWSASYTIAPWTIAGASCISLIILRLWFNKIYCCEFIQHKANVTDAKIHADIDRTHMRHQENEFQSSGDGVRAYVMSKFRNDATNIYYYLSNNGPQWPMYYFWVQHKYAIMSGAKNGVVTHELFEEHGDLFVKYNYSGEALELLSAGSKELGKFNITAITNVRTALTYIEFELPGGLK